MTVNHDVVGSSPTGGVMMYRLAGRVVRAGRRSTVGNRVNVLIRFKGSNPLLSVYFIYYWPVGQAVKTPPFHGGNTGSNPVRVMKLFGELAQLGERLPYKQDVGGSSPSFPIAKI